MTERKITTKELIFDISNELDEAKKKANARMSCTQQFIELTNKRIDCLITIDFPKISYKFIVVEGGTLDALTLILAVYDATVSSVTIGQPWFEIGAESIFTNFADLLKNSKFWRLLKLGKFSKIKKSGKLGFLGQKNYEDFQKLFEGFDEFLAKYQSLTQGHFVFAIVEFIFFLVFDEEREYQDEIDEAFGSFTLNARKANKLVDDFLKMPDLKKKFEFMMKFATEAQEQPQIPAMGQHMFKFSAPSNNLGLQKSQSMRNVPNVQTTQGNFFEQNSGHYQGNQTIPNLPAIGLNRASSLVNVVNNGLHQSQTGFYPPLSQRGIPRPQAVQSYGSVSARSIGGTFPQSRIANETTATSSNPFMDEDEAENEVDSNPFGGFEEDSSSNPFGEFGEFGEFETSLNQPLDSTPFSMQGNEEPDTQPFGEKPLEDDQSQKEASNSSRSNLNSIDSNPRLEESGQVEPKPMKFGEKLSEEECKKFLVEKGEVKPEQKKLNTIIPVLEQPQNEDDFNENTSESETNKTNNFNLIPVDIPKEKQEYDQQYPKIKPSLKKANARGSVNPDQFYKTNTKNERYRTRKPVQIMLGIDFKHLEIEGNQSQPAVMSHETIMNSILIRDNFDMRECIVNLLYRIEHDFKSTETIYSNDFESIILVKHQIWMIQSFRLPCFEYCLMVYLSLRERKDFNDRFDDHNKRRLIIKLIKIFENSRDYGYFKNRFLDINNNYQSIGKIIIGSDSMLRNFASSLLRDLNSMFMGEINLRMFTKTTNPAFTSTPKYMKYLYSKILTKTNLTQEEFKSVLTNFEDNNIDETMEDPEQKFICSIVKKYIDYYQNFKDENEIFNCLKLVRFYYQTSENQFDTEIENKILNQTLKKSSSLENFMSEQEISLYIVRQKYISKEGKDMVLKKLLTSLKSKKKRKKKGFFKKLVNLIFGDSSSSQIPSKITVFVNEILQDLNNQISLLYDDKSAIYMIVKSIMMQKSSKKTEKEQNKIRGILEEFSFKITCQDFTMEEIESFNSIKDKKAFKKIQTEILNWVNGQTNYQNMEALNNICKNFWQMKNDVPLFEGEIEKLKSSISNKELDSVIDFQELRMRMAQMGRDSVKYQDLKAFVEEIKTEYGCFNLMDQIINESSFGKFIVQLVLKNKDFDRIDDLVIKRLRKFEKVDEIDQRGGGLSHEMSMENTLFSNSGTSIMQTNPFLRNPGSKNMANFGLFEPKKNPVSIDQSDLNSDVTQSHITMTPNNQNLEDREMDLMDPSIAFGQKIIFSSGKTILERLERALVEFFRDSAKDFPREVFLSIKEQVLKPKYYNKMMETLDLEKDVINDFSTNIAFFMVLDSSVGLLDAFEEFRSKLGIRMEENIDPNFVEFCKEITTYANDRQIKSEKFIDMLDGFGITKKYINMVSKNASIIEEIPKVLKVIKYFREVGDVHVNEIENEGDLEKYAITNSDLIRLRKLKQMIDNASNEHSSKGFSGFCEVINVKIKTSKSLKKVKNYINILADKSEELISLSRDFLNQDVSGKDKLKDIMEKSDFHFNLQTQSEEVYNVRATIKKGEKKDIDSKQLEELRVKLSIASFSSNQQADDDESKILSDKRDCFLKVYSCINKIKGLLKDIYLSGYVYNLKEALVSSYHSNNKRAHFLKFEEGNWNFSCKILRFRKDRIIDNFESFLSNLKELFEETSKNAIDLLTSNDHYWLTYLNGSQYKGIINYISNENQSDLDDEEILNIIKYCFGQKNARNILQSHFPKRGIEISDIHRFNTLEILKTININSERFSIRNGHQQDEFLKQKQAQKISFLGYDSQKYLYFLRMLALNNLKINQPNRFLFCNKNTKKHIIYSFLQRAIFNPSKSLFFCIDLHLLSRENFNFFLSTLNKIVSNPKSVNNNPFDDNFVNEEVGIDINYKLVIIVKSDSKNNYREELQKLNIIQSYPISTLQYDVNSEASEEWERNLRDLRPENIKIYSSEFSGLGKSHQIRAESMNNRAELLTLFLAGDLNPKNLNDRIEALKEQMQSLEGSKMDLCLKLDIMEGYEENIQILDQILFQIIFLKCIALKDSYVFFDKFNNFYLEVGNTFKNVLMRGLSFIQIYTDTGDEDSLVYINEVTIEEINYQELESDMPNYVSNYLWMLENDQIEGKTYEEFFVSPAGNVVFAQIATQERLRLILDQYIDHRKGLTLEKTSYSQLKNFIKILGSQLQKFDSLYHFTPECLTSQQIGNSLRSLVLEKIISLAKQYAWSSSSIVRQSQIQNKKILKRRRNKDIADDVNSELKIYANILKKLPKWEQWDETEDSTLYFGNGCMKPIYKNPLNLPKNIKEIIIANTFGMNQVPDYANYSDEEFIQQIGEALNQGTEEMVIDLKNRTKDFKGKGYVITMDNYLKILLICQRADEGIPIILQGETGCGKTFMVNYISSCLLQEEFRCFTLHSGITEEEFTARILDYCNIAQRLTQGKRLWVLLDEFNTSPLQALLAEIMIERQCTFTNKLNSIPENLVFVACCNPYRNKSISNDKNKNKVGLVHESSQSALSHKVFPIPDSLINYVWDFGQLSPEAEEKYIEAIIKSNAKGNYKYLKDKKYISSIRISVTTAQKFIRKLENDSSVSLRDVQRFIVMFKFLHGERNRKAESLNQGRGYLYKFEQALSLTITMCYLLRIGDKRERSNLSQKIETKMKRILNVRGRNFEIQKVFDEEATKVAKAANDINCIPDDISLNKPLKENLLVCLCCVQLRIPVLMCGKPGTSKTVSIEILKNILSSSLRGSNRTLQRFKPCSMEQFWGSLNTTAESIQKLFDKAKSELSRNPNQNRAIIFDEVGLAEIAPENPLKVLHPLLDPSSEDESKRYKRLVRENEQKRLKNIEDNIDNDMDDAIAEPQAQNGLNSERDKMVGFIGISNWRLDVSKMNRILFVSRPDMDEEDLKDTCVTIFESSAEKSDLYNEVDKRDVKGHKDSLDSIWGIIAKVYFQFREYELKNKGHKNFHGSRDFYSLVKFIINSLQNRRRMFERKIKEFNEMLTGIVAAGIERNFSGKEIEVKGRIMFASKHVKNLFKEALEEEGFEFQDGSLDSETPVFQLIRSNLESEKSRHLMIFTDGAYLDNIIIDQIKRFKKNQQKMEKNGIEEEEEDAKVVYFMRSEGKDDVFDITTKLPQYIEEDYTVIMKDLDEVYGCLYDLLNQKYKNIGGEDYCNIFYDDHKKQFKVNKRFRIVLLMQREDIGAKFGQKKQPAPFLNRFEKHLVKYESLMDLKTKKKLDGFKKLINQNIKPISKMHTKENLQKHMLIHNYNEELLVSLVCEGSKDNFIDAADLIAFKEEEHVETKIEGKRMRGNPYRGRHDDIDSNEYKDLTHKLIRMFSRNAILCFMNKFQGKYNPEEARKKEDKLINRFIKRHGIPSLNQFLAKFKKAKLKKSIIFTFTYAYEVESILESNPDRQNILLKTIGEINMEGSTSKAKSLRTYLSKPEVHTLIIQFTDRKEWSFIEHIKAIIDDIMNQKDEDDQLIYEGKKVLFIAQYSAEDYTHSYEVKTSINFMTEDWTMVVIDDLVDSDYKNFFKFMKMRISEFLNHDEISNDLMLQIILERLMELFNLDIRNSEDQGFFIEIVNFINNNSHFTKKLGSLVREKEGIEENDEREKRVFEVILQKGLLRNLSMDYKDTLKIVLKKSYGESLYETIDEVMSKFRLMDRIVYEKYRDNPTIQTMISDWDQDFLSFEPEPRNVFTRATQMRPMIVEQCEELGRLEFTLSDIAKKINKIHKYLIKKDEFNSLIDDKKKSAKEKIKMVNGMIKVQIKLNEVDDHGISLLESDSALKELIQVEIVGQIIGKLRLLYKNRQKIVEMVNKILTGRTTTHQRDQFLDMENDVNGPLEPDTASFMAFCYIYTHDIKFLGTISKGNRGIDLTSRSNINNFVASFQAGGNLKVEQLIGKNISNFLDFRLKKDLRENIRVLNSMKEEFKNFGYLDFEIKSVIEIIIIIKKVILKLSISNRSGHSRERKKSEALLKEIKIIAKQEEEQMNHFNQDDFALALHDLIQVVNGVNQEEMSKEVMTELMEYLLDLLIKAGNDDRDCDIDEESKFQVVVFLLNSVFTYGNTELVNEFTINSLARGIVANLEFDLEREFDVIRNKKFANEFENVFTFNLKDEQKVKFLMLLTDSIIRKVFNQIASEDKSGNRTNYSSMFESSEPKMEKILDKLRTKALTPELISEGKLLEYATRIAMFRLAFTKLLGKEGVSIKMDYLIEEFYRKNRTQPLSLYAIQRLLNTIGITGLKDNHFGKTLDIWEGLNENNEDNFIIPNENIIIQAERMKRALRDEEQVIENGSEDWDMRLAALSLYTDIEIFQDREDKEQVLQGIEDRFINSGDKFICNVFKQKIGQLEGAFPNSFEGVDNGNQIMLKVILNFFSILEISKDIDWDFNKKVISSKLSNLRFLVKYPPKNFSSLLELSNNANIGTRLWRCTCGYEFVVANCGQLNGGGTCPECQRPIGGVGNHNTGGRERTQTNTGSLSDLGARVLQMRNELRRGYTEHKVDRLEWGLAAYPELRNYSTIVFSHMVTELVLLYRSLKKNNRPTQYRKHLDKIFNDFEILRTELHKDHRSIGYLICRLHYKLYEQLKLSSVSSIHQFIQNQISQDLNNPNQIITEYIETKNRLIAHKTSNNEVMRNYIARSTTINELQSLWGENDILMFRMLREFKEFSDHDFSKYVSRDPERHQFMNTLQQNYQLFSRFKDCFLPLARLSLYLTDEYSFTITRDQALEMDMADFVENHRDAKLKNYYEEAKEILLSENKLLYLVNNYSNLLKFSIGCENFDGIGAKIKDGEAKLIMFLLTKGRRDEEVFMSVILDGLINLQNMIIDNEENIEIFKRVNQEGSKLGYYQWERIASNQKVENIKVDIRYLKEQHILHLDASSIELVKHSCSLSTEFLRENEFLPHLSEIEKVCSTNFFLGKRKVKKTQEMSHRNYFKFAGDEEEPLINLLERYFNFASIELKLRNDRKFNRILSGLDSLEEIKNIENLLRKIIQELELGYVIDKDKLLCETMDNKIFKLMGMGIQKSVRDKLRKITVKKLGGFVWCLLVKKGELLYKSKELQLFFKNHNRRGSVVNKFKRAAERILDSATKKKKLLREFMVALVGVDSVAKMHEKGKYEIKYLEEEFDLFIMKYGVLEAMKLNKKEKLILKDIGWMIEELKRSIDN